MRVLGIDPGASGALALLVGGSLVNVIDMPTLKVTLAGGTVKTRIDCRELADILRHFQPEAVFLEQVNSHAGEGPAGAFSFGRSVGSLEGAIAAVTGLYPTEVPPQAWKRVVGVRKGPEGDTKGPALDKARQLWPECGHLFRRKKDDGRADAALVGFYGHLTLAKL